MDTSGKQRKLLTFPIVEDPWAQAEGGKEGSKSSGASELWTGPQGRHSSVQLGGKAKVDNL
jgi:hypothetical protein